MPGPVDQPLPTPGGENVTPVVVQWFNRDLLARERKGIATYGTTLQTWNGRDAGLDAWEELLDLAQYLVQLRLEHDDVLAENAVLRHDNAALRADVVRLAEFHAACVPVPGVAPVAPVAGDNGPATPGTPAPAAPVAPVAPDNGVATAPATAPVPVQGGRVGYGHLPPARRRPWWRRWA